MHAFSLYFFLKIFIKSYSIYVVITHREKRAERKTLFSVKHKVNRVNARHLLFCINYECESVDEFDGET